MLCVATKHISYICMSVTYAFMHALHREQLHNIYNTSNSNERKNDIIYTLDRGITKCITHKRLVENISYWPELVQAQLKQDTPFRYLMALFSLSLSVSRLSSCSVSSFFSRCCCCFVISINFFKSIYCNRLCIQFTWSGMSFAFVWSTYVFNFNYNVC